MANHSDADLKWITVHPNGKGEEPGVHIALKGGMVVKGPKGIKDKINSEGGLSGAKSVPLEHLKNVEQHIADMNPSFFDYCGHQVGISGDEYKEALKKYLISHPDELHKNSNGFFDTTSYLDVVDFIKAEGDKSKGSEKEDPDFTAPSDDDFEGLFADGEGNKDAPDFTAPKDSDFTSLFEDDKENESFSGFTAPKDDDFSGLFDDEETKENVTPANEKPGLPASESHNGEVVLSPNVQTYWNNVGKDVAHGIFFTSSGKAKKGFSGITQEIAEQCLKEVLSGPYGNSIDEKGMVNGPFDPIEKQVKELAKSKLGKNVESQGNAGTPEPSPSNKPSATPFAPTVGKTDWNGDTTGGHKFPTSMDEVKALKKIKTLGGASGAQATLYEDAEGNQYVMKRFEASDKVGQARLKEECDADTYYLAGGATVPHFKLYGDEKSGYVKLSRFIPGTKTLGAVWGSADEAMKKKIKEGLRKNFALDVMAGAWDVLGTGQDNILIDQDGNVIRCDNGGCFNRRAQGGEKTKEEWGNGHIDDLWTMRGLAPGLDGKTVPDATGKKNFFGDITTHQLLSDIAARDWDTMIAHLPPATKAVMQKRISNAKDYHGVCDNVVTAGMYGDGQHSEDITLNYHCLNKFGAMLGCKNDNIAPQNWGFCRGNGNGTNAKPTLSKFFAEDEPKIEDFTNAPEPKIESYLPQSDVNHAANVLKTAGISLNKHLFVDKDGKPNMASVDAALNLKPQLSAVAVGNDENAKTAKKMLDYVVKIEEMKAGGFKNLETEMQHSPTGPVDLNTDEAKAKAQKKFEEDHQEWKNKIGDAENQFAAAHKQWETKKVAAEKKLAKAVEEWENETDGQSFGFKNLTDCFEQFCKQNGIESQRFWDMAKDQGGQSYSNGSCRMKALELRAMGFSWEQIGQDKCEGVTLAHLPNTKMVAKEFKNSAGELAKYSRPYIAMKALTQMLLRHSTFVGNFKDRHVVRMCRTENNTNVIKAYGIQKGKPTIYPIGSHESFGVFKTVTYKGTEAVFCDVPYSRISSIYFLNNPSGDSMYASDGENESGVNAVGLKRVYWKHVSSSIPLTEAYDFVDKAFGVKSPKMAVG